MGFETPSIGQPKRENPAPENPRKGMMEAGRVTFQDMSVRPSEVPRRNAPESSEKSWLEIIGKGDVNAQAAFKSLVNESGVSEEALKSINSDGNAEGHMTNLAKAYLEAWRSTASDAARRAEAVREKFRGFVKDRLQ